MGYNSQKKMKKLIYAFCAIALCLAFTSCEKTKKNVGR